MLPEDRVVLLTSAGLLLVHAQGFTQLDGAAEIGGRAGRRTWAAPVAGCPSAWNLLCKAPGNPPFMQLLPCTLPPQELPL